MQAKDIPELPLLRFIEEHTPAGPFIGVGWHDLQPRSAYSPTIRDALPDDIPDKVILAKMKGLIRRRLVSGCDCGCRGDFQITERGREHLAKGGPKA